MATSKPYRIQPVNAAGLPSPSGVIPAGAVLFDGGSCEGWTPRTLLVGVQGPTPEAGRATGALSSGLVTGWVDFELSGLRLGMPFVRRFSLYAYQQVRIPLTFDGVGLRVVAPSSALRGFAAVALLSDEEVSGGAEATPRLLYATEDAAAATFRVPDGAIELLPATAAPAFTWSAFGDIDKIVPVAAPAFVGVPQPVGGQVYAPGVAGFRAVWRIGV